MELLEIYKIILVILLIVCAVSVNLTRNLLSAVIIFMSYSSIMCLLWILMESPDLAITEAAVGAGVSGFLFLVTLKKLRQMGAGDAAQEFSTAAEAVSGVAGISGGAEASGAAEEISAAQEAASAPDAASGQKKRSRNGAKRRRKRQEGTP